MSEPMLEMRSEPVQIVGRDLLRLGGSVRIDARLSWRGPADAGFYEPLNVYLLKDKGGALLVEAGVPLLAETIQSQLASTLEDTSPLRVAVTRNEPDCISNIPNLARSPGIEMVYSPGLMNPLDYFDDVSARLQMLSFGAQQVAVRPGDRIPIGTTRVLQAVQTPLRMLSTTWYYQVETSTLFCSDMFTDGLARAPDQIIISEPVGLAELVPAMRRHLALRYDWLSRSDLTPIIAGLEELFEKLDIETLAPSRGCVITGRPATQERIEALLTALRAAGRA